MTNCQRLSTILLVTILLASSQAQAQSDQDSDGVPDYQDNCLMTANPSQFDSNGDGYGSACDPDLDNNGIVNFLDLMQMRTAFFATPVSPNWNPDADFNNDGIINFLDLQVMNHHFFGPPGPVGVVRWVNPASGDWNEPANWFPLGIPIAPNFVLIDTPGIVVTHISGDNECAGMISQADIALSGASRLTVFGDMDMQGSLIMTDENTTLGSARITRTVASEGGAPLILETGVAFDNITLAVDLTIPNSLLVNFDNGLTLDDTSLTLSSNGTIVTRARFRGTGTLGGTGEILFAGTTADHTMNRLFPDAIGDVLTVGPGITVRSLTAGGWVGTNAAGRGVNFLGSLATDVSGAVIALQGDSLAIDGSLDASNGSTIRVDGDWTASSTTTMIATAGGELELFGDWSSEATINVTDGLLDIGNNNNADAWTNLGMITVVNSNAELGGVFGPDDIGSTTIDGITTLNGRLILTGLIFDIDTGPGTWQLGTGGIIQDGMVTGTLLNIVGDSRLDGTTLAAHTEVNNGAIVVLVNGLNLDNVSLTLASDGAFTAVRADGSQTLGGTGWILYGGTTTSDTANWLYPVGNGDVLTIGPGVTVRTTTTGGRLGENLAGRGLTILGLVIADTAGAILTVQGDLLTIDGPLTGSGGSSIVIDGNWSASADSTIAMSGGGTLGLLGDWTSSATVTVTDSALDIGENDSGGWINLGSIDLVNSDATFGGSFMHSSVGTITSDGTITIDGALDNVGGTLDFDILPGTWQLGSGTITGGTIAGTTFDVTGFGATLDGVTLSSDMVLRSGLDLKNGLTLDDASVTMISNGIFLQISAKGTQTIGGTGEILFSGTASNRIHAFGYDDVLTIGSGITVRTLSAGGSLGTPGRGLTILGSVVSNVNAANITVQGHTMSIEGALMSSNGATITVDGDWTATSTATMSMTSSGELVLLGQWLNNGAITATNSFLDIGDTDLWTNLGTIDLVGTDANLGGAFVFGDIGIFTSDGTVTIVGEFDNTGMTLDLDSLSGTWELGDGEIIAGTIAGTSFLVSSDGELNGVTLSVDTTIGNANFTEVTVTNGLTLDNASITLESSGTFFTAELIFVGSQTLGGTGEILFGGTGNSDLHNSISGANDSTLTIGPNVTIRPLTSGGVIGSSFQANVTILQGSVVSDLPGEVITIGGSFINNGSVIIDAGSVINGSADYMQGPGGRLEVEISSTFTSEFGRLDLFSFDSSVAFNGTLDIVFNGLIPSLGDTFEIISAGSRSGTFATVTGTDAGNGNTFVPIYNVDNVTLEVQ